MLRCTTELCPSTWSSTQTCWWTSSRCVLRIYQDHDMDCLALLHPRLESHDKIGIYAAGRFLILLVRCAQSTAFQCTEPRQT